MNSVDRNETSPAGLLSGVSVIEVGEFIAVPFAGRLMRLLGADVTYVDVPGDPATALPSRTPGALAAFLRDGKSAVRGPIDEHQLDDRCREADVCVIDAALLPPHWSPPPETLVAVLSGCEHGHPPLSRSALLCAEAGVSIAIGEPGRRPLPMPGFSADFLVGTVFAGASLALLAAGATGLHRNSALVTLSAFVEQNSTSYRLSGIGWRREGRRAAGCAGIYPYGIYPCADGQVALIARSRRDWQDIATALGAAEVYERYPDPFLIASSQADEVDRELISYLRRFTKADILQVAEQQGILAVPVADVGDVRRYDHLDEERGFWQSVHGNRVPGLPFIVTAAEGGPR